MNDLLQTYTLLAAGLRDDPLLCLASAVCWLDPLWQDAGEDCDVPQDEDGTLGIALTVARKAFPDVYIQAVEAIRHGASYTDLDRLICAAITEDGIPLESLEWVGFGVPMPAYGAVLDDPDFYSAYPDVVPVLACFGISPKTNPNLNASSGHINVPNCAYTAGRMIAASLQQHDDERYRQVSWLIQHLFSCSGNTVVDLSPDELCELQPLSWEAEDLAFARDIIEEADGILADAMAGLAFLNDHPEMLQALQRNVRRIYKAIEKQKGKSDEPRIRLAWPCLADSPERAAESVA